MFLISLVILNSLQCLVECSVHALRGVMGNQGKIAKKQSGKMYVYLHISILRFIFERKLIL